jgi:hypothetical protein
MMTAPVENGVTSHSARRTRLTPASVTVPWEAAPVELAVEYSDDPDSIAPALLDDIGAAADAVG